MSDDRVMKLRDLGANVRLGREGETVVLFGFCRIPTPDESREEFRVVRPPGAVRT